MLGIELGMCIALTQPIHAARIVRSAPAIAVQLDASPADGPSCYPNCDQSTGTPLLTANDFICFFNHFMAGNSYANCDGVGGLVSGEDFICFLIAFNSGCS